MSEQNLVYAGFWRRFGSMWMDTIILLPWLAISIYISNLHRTANLYMILPGMIVGLWYNVYLVKRYGATPGKLVLGLRILKVDHSPVDFKSAFIRNSVVFVLSIITGIAISMGALALTDEEYKTLSFIQRAFEMSKRAPSWYNPSLWAMNFWVWSEYIVLLFNKKRQGPMDFMASTVVVIKKSLDQKLQQPSA